MADFYDILGVARGASADEVKRAYRKRARELHPDANPDDPGAEDKFKELSRAYEVLSDPQQRANYDRFGEAGVGGGAGGGDPFGGGGLGDIFEAFFGGNSPFGGGFGGRGPAGPPRGQDIETIADITFENAVFGGTVPVTLKTALKCDDCGGTGAGSGTKPVACVDCEGTGQVRRVRQSLLGQMVTSSACQRCGGIGQVVATPCATCRGDGRIVDTATYQIDVPAGVDTGATLRLSGRGAVGPRGGTAGDLYVHVRVAPHATLQRDDYDLVYVLRLGIAQAALGTTAAIDTLEGSEELTVPAGTQHGKEFTLRGRGVP
ncbi:MAG: DnaJ C-terminal domain-containing protein, partial [Actinomycetota bacterium]